MNDLIDRLAAANPVLEDQRPPVEDVWRKIAEAPARRPGWRRAATRVTLGIAVAVPVLAVLMIALSVRGVHRHVPQPAAGGAAGAHSTLDHTAQLIATRALAGRSGSIVVLNPQTGAVEALATAGTSRTGSGVLLPPAATFDLVTAAAALDSGRYAPNSRISGRSPQMISGSRVSNDNAESFGPVTLGDALNLSVNTVFARVGVDLGARTITTYMQRFGFYSSPGVPGQPVSGALADGTLALPTSGRVPIGPLAAGQGNLAATPLQMAMVAATVANAGLLARPHLSLQTKPVPQQWVISPHTAHALTQMLRQVVLHGTGTAANIPGLQIAGKTGTTPNDPGMRNTVAWFIGLAPAKHPTIAIAVVLLDPHGGYGGTVAAPIATQIIHSLLNTHH